MNYIVSDWAEMILFMKIKSMANIVQKLIGIFLLTLYFHDNLIKKINKSPRS
ncbi:hypothetical protein NIES80_13970 [Dolichospermum planctonicum]|uniref:Uncharacterized protein n=1 Tax=Dolichospermum planctonicum TaxID=136072 RepID=A0A480A9E3_9CYAN|nr:hypothetical protein NIES80_13970 [Dolichospermum planctonicum]